MKKLFALMMAVALMLTAMSSALAYTTVKPAANQPAITHTLTLTESGATGLAYDITYKFEVGEVTVVQPAGITNASAAVTGTPVISDIQYGPNDAFDASHKSCTKNLAIDWSGVSIMEPGVYRWEVTKSVETNSNETASNNRVTSYLFAYAIDNGGTLSIASVILAADEVVGEDTVKGNLEDQYPAKTLNLTISKNVTGNQGSKNQYFKFTVNLTSPAGAVAKTYNIKGNYDAEVPPTAYNNATNNVSTIAVNANGTGSVELWLKHGQTAEIENLLYGTAYTVTESENEGYTVTSAITGDTTDTKAEGATASDTSLTASSTVAFTNNREATVPTGIELHTSAAIMGILLAAGLMMLMLIGKRKAVTE